jgi:hypothetical protein
MFKTVVAERPFVGMIRPLTELEYWYERLPMGLSNSPGISRRFGMAFLGLIIENCHEFQGCAILNKPALLVWIHVDDAFAHGTSKGNTYGGFDLYHGHCHASRFDL